MHSLLFLLLLTLSTAAVAVRFTGFKHTSSSTAVRNYLGRLAPASKNTLLYELMGPTVGSDVNTYPYSITSYALGLTSLFLHLSQVSSFPLCPIQNTLNMLCTGSGMVVAPITPGSMN